MVETFFGQIFKKFDEEPFFRDEATKNKNKYHVYCVNYNFLQLIFEINIPYFLCNFKTTTHNLQHTII
jgi:hypothetical protein